MKISPEMFVELHKEKKHNKCLTVRDELIADIREFENKAYDSAMDDIYSVTEVLY